MSSSLRTFTAFSYVVVQRKGEMSSRCRLIDSNGTLLPSACEKVQILLLISTVVVDQLPANLLIFFALLRWYSVSANLAVRSQSNHLCQFARAFTSLLKKVTRLIFSCSSEFSPNSSCLLCYVSSEMLDIFRPSLTSPPFSLRLSL